LERLLVAAYFSNAARSVQGKREQEGSHEPVKTVIIMRGVSGSGKTTYVREHYPGATVVSADDYFTKDGAYCFNPAALDEAHADCFRRFIYALENGAPTVVVDNTNATAAQVSPYALGARAFGYEVRIITLQVHPETAFERNVHGAPLSIIRKQATELQGLPSYYAEEIIW
jgi:predicted kinase